MISGDWANLDDDKVSLVNKDQILKLSGGGDWHVAYILLYAPRRLEKLKETEVSQGIESWTTRLPLYVIKPSVKAKLAPKQLIVAIGLYRPTYTLENI